MKNKTIMFVLIAVVVASVIWYFISNKKKKEAISFQDNEVDTGFTGLAKPEKTPEGKTIVPHSGVTPKGGTDKDFFRAMGFSYDYLSRMSKSDARIARKYTEDYLRKGRKILPNNPMYKDLVRIKKYMGDSFIPGLDFNPILTPVNS